MNAPDQSLHAKIQAALAQVEPMATVASTYWSIATQLHWCATFASGQPYEKRPGPFTMGLIATREFDMWGDRPELAALINEIEAEVERMLGERRATATIQNIAPAVPTTPPTARQCVLTFLGQWLTIAFLLWLAHTLAYLAHEYSHTLVAWLLGWKTNPLALDYGHFTLDNLLYLSDVDENVDYAPIFASGHGAAAALIAVAGVLFGNGLGYLASRALYARAKARGRRIPGLLLFLLCLMNVGNLISYVPMRTFATHADMATVQQGLGISPWWIAILLGIPFCLAAWHFVVRILPGALPFLLPGRNIGQAALGVLAAYVLFVFFGAAGLRRYGEISHWLSAISMYALFPLAALIYLSRSLKPRG